ncbi:hypothetical protein DFH09DRAFT_1127898 [Mycena vulgaris]|nr:hypothetical protein DFH09DRAFT_1127898 [Mycena vulgaris]
MPPAPILPPELQREILEFAALSSTKSIPKLLLVGHQVKTWLEPLLYRVVVFRDSLSGHVCFSVDQFLAGMRSKPRTFAHQHVHHLFVSYGIVALLHKELETLLSICTGVHNLVLINDDTHPRPWLAPRLSAMLLQRLCINLANLFAPAPIDFSHPLFAQITHLDLLDDAHGAWVDYAGLAGLPRLTHLSFDLSLATRTHTMLATSIVQGVVVHCPALCVLVLLWSAALREAIQHDPEAVGEIVALAQDGRVVMTLLPLTYAQDWQSGARGGEDYWTRAEGLVGHSAEIRSDLFHYR